MEKFHGKLEGKIVLTVAPPELAFPTAPLAAGTRRKSCGTRDRIDPTGSGRGGRGGRGALPGNMTSEERRAFRQKLASYWKEEKAVMTIQTNARAESGTLFAGGAQNRKEDANVPPVSITAEHYNRIARLLQHKVPVKLQFDIKTKWDTPTPIRSTSSPRSPAPRRRMRSSWSAATSTLALWHRRHRQRRRQRGRHGGDAGPQEAQRQNGPHRAHGMWGGEEEGLLGSRAYVKEHFADPAVMKTTAEHAHFAGYFNIDNGTGRIRGVYLQGNEMVRPVFEQWFAPFKDLTPGVITIRNTGGTDHLSFDAVGLPGFQFIQDPMDYDTRTHHSNMDVYDRIQQADLKQMAVIEAAFVYNAATRPEKLPRKDLPAAQPAGRGGRGF